MPGVPNEPVVPLRKAMTKRTSTTVPTLAGLIRRTARLRRDLVALVRNFPEDDLELGDRIFVRLLNPMWRNRFGKKYEPDQKKQIAAVEWIERYRNYLRDVEVLICGVMLQPEMFNTLPLHSLPTLPPYQYSADECVRRLDVQEAALRRLRNQEVSPQSGKGDEQASLLTRQEAFLESLEAKVAPAPATPDPNALMTANEAAELLRIDVKTVYSYVKRGLLPYVKIQSNVRFLRSALLEWMAKRQYKPEGRSSRKRP